MRKIDICIIGPLPPPHGGVSVSVSSYFTELKKSGVNVIHLNQSEIYRLPFIKPRVVHLNLSKSYKRFLMTMFVKLCGAKVVHMIHGNQFNTEKLFNLYAAKLSHRILCLNEDIYKRLKNKFGDKVFKVTPIVECESDNTNETVRKKVDKKYKTLLLYAAGRVFIDDEEVYGVDFVLNILPALISKGYQLTLLDPKKDYEQSVNSLDVDCKKHLRYITDYVNFKDLLLETDIYLRPTSTDGQSVAVLEALSYGVKVIASNKVARPEGVLLYDYGSPNSLVEALSLEAEAAGPKPKLTKIDDYLEILAGK